MNTLVKKIDALLPQTQCQECGFAGCMPYAEALAQGSASIDKCPPGGIATVEALAQLLEVDAKSYRESAINNTRPPALASIREAECIGCTKCIQACPVDAIIGTSKSMHAIIDQECTGCGLCIEPCPVDCIDLLPLTAPVYDRAQARENFQAKQIRELRLQQVQQQAYREKSRLAASSKQPEMKAKQDYILQALARVQAKKHE